MHAQRDAAVEIEVVEGTIPPGERLREVMDGADVAFSLVGYSTPATAAQDPVSSASASVIPALTVLECARRSGVPRVVIASSGGTIYGPASDLPTPEAHRLQPISVHGVHSQAIESYADLYRRSYGLGTVVLRFSTVYGPGERVRGEQGVIAAWCEALARDEPVVVIGDGETRRDFLYASDAAAAAEAAGALDVSGVYNVGSGRSHSLAELLQVLEQVTGRTPRVEYRSKRAIDVPVTELDSLLFSTATGWVPRYELAEGVERTWAWTNSTLPRPGDVVLD